MSAWAGKYVIGLTGNIATGKSVVRKMLEHLGAYGINADALAHRAMMKGSPGYQPVLDTFGKWILAPDGQIDRNRLAHLVFADAEALARLEAIVHPLVIQAVDILIRRSSQKVIVIEAIKLIESGLHKKCDALWVTYAPQDAQLSRLMQKRGMSEATARHRINMQSPMESKIGLANVVIRNDGSFEQTWQQVYTAWQRAFPVAEAEALQAIQTTVGEATVERARPKDAEKIAGLINQLSAGRRRLTHEDIMASFGEKAFLLLRVEGKALGLVGWKVENLVACTDDVYLDSSLLFTDALGILMTEVERASKELQCEISLLFLPAGLSKQETVFKTLGYQQRRLDSLGVRAWEEAAAEALKPGYIMYFKQLRRDRVLRPV